MASTSRRGSRRARARGGGNFNAPVHRNPTRTRQPTRRADAPITYAPQAHVGSEIDVSASDSDDSSHQFSLPQQLLTLDSRDSSVELLDGPPQRTATDNNEDLGMASDTTGSPIVISPGNEEITPACAEVRFMICVDGAGCSYEDKVTMLITEIRRLQSISAGEPSSPPAEPLASTTVPGASNDTVDIIPSVIDADDLYVTDALYLVCLNTVQVSRTFVEQRHHIHRCGMIDLVAVEEGGARLRCLCIVGASELKLGPPSKLTETVVVVHIIPLHLDRIVGSSDEEMCSVACRDLSHHPLQQAPGLETETALNEAPQAMPTANFVAAPTVAAQAPAAALSAQAGLQPGVTEYLRDKYQDRLARIERVRALRCGAAYCHCTEEKNFASICTSLGLRLSDRIFHLVTVPEGLVISYNVNPRCHRCLQSFASASMNQTDSLLQSINQSINIQLGVQ
ncbi:hypothetical protein DFH06DRAFT_1326687 [Mycena polygramma]|nr:hypothetical protein DFH06DRAFT_1326687 [Mycena polygramma]